MIIVLKSVVQYSLVSIQTSMHNTYDPTQEEHDKREI